MRLGQLAANQTRLQKIGAYHERTADRKSQMLDGYNDMFQKAPSYLYVKVRERKERH